MPFKSSKYSLTDLTVSATGRAKGVSNLPTSDDHLTNLSLLGQFLETLPFELKLNSAYRSKAVNDLVHGSKTSQHMNGLAADVTPVGLTNKELATWFWVNKAEYPELDQVIWYTDTTHTHIGVCPLGSIKCRGPNGQFLAADKEGGNYLNWQPTQAEIAAIQQKYPSVKNRVTLTQKARFFWSRPSSWGYLALATAILTSVSYYALKQRKQRK